MIYFVEMPDYKGSIVKIGFREDNGKGGMKKKWDIAYGYSHPHAKLIGLISGDKKDEKEIQNSFKHLKLTIKNEWFKKTDEIDNFLLDKEMLPEYNAFNTIKKGCSFPSTV